MKNVYRLARHQLSNLHRWLTGKPLKYAELSSMTLDHDDIDLARKFIKNDATWFDNDIVKSFETKFAEWNRSKYAFSFLGGRECLVAIIKALELKPGDEVIIPGYTCVVVANGFKAHGIKMNFCDIELDTFGLDANAVQQRLTRNTKAILIQHLYGLVCRDYERLIFIAKNSNLTVIEDCAQATGASYKGTKVGNYGDVAFYSSEQTKVFNTVKGGLAVTNDDNIGERLLDVYKKTSNPDKKWIDCQLHTVLLNYYQFKHPKRHILGDIHNMIYGHKRIQPYSDDEFVGKCHENYVRKMPAPIAALALNQLRKLEYYNCLRRETAKKWDSWCEQNGYRKPVVIESSIPVYLRYPVMVEPEKKKDISWAYNELGVSLGVWFVSNIHPASWPVNECPHADKAVRQCINFPTLLG